jgi:hypothetical protein
VIGKVIGLQRSVSLHLVLKAVFPLCLVFARTRLYTLNEASLKGERDDPFLISDVDQVFSRVLAIGALYCLSNVSMKTVSREKEHLSAFSVGNSTSSG